jgi:hypothetical protein
MIDLDLDQNEGEWFQFFTSHIDPNNGEVIYDPPDSDARVQVRSILPFVEERLLKRKRNVEHVLNPKTRTMERVSFNPDLSPEEEKKEREDLWDYAIVGFENFKDRKTAEVIECTRENKLKLMKVPVFDRFIARCLQMISDSQTRAKQESQKNL